MLINCRHIDENSWNSSKNPKLEIFGMEKFGFGHLIDMVIYIYMHYVLIRDTI